MHITNPPLPATQPASVEDAQRDLENLRAARKRRKWTIGGAVMVVAVVGLGVAKLLEPLPSVRAVTVEAKTTERVLAVTGRVKPRESVQVFPRVAGQIVSLSKDEGDLVQAGDVLGQVDPARAQSSLAQSAAAVEAQRRILAQAERDLERAQTLLNRGSATVAGVETATLAVAKGREDLRRLEAARNDARLRLEEFAIIAPFSGRILNRPVDPGQVVEVRTALFDIAPTAAQEVESEVDEAYSMALNVGQSARMAFAGLPQPAEGKVNYLAPEIQTSTGGRLVRLSFTPPNAVADNELPVGLSVDVNIVIDTTANALTVPRQAIRDIGAKPYVLVVKDGAVAKQEISFIDWPAQSVIVTSGLKVGDIVITNQTAPAIGTKVEIES
jgi:RND family efflux transporter MFP subunit